MPDIRLKPSHSKRHEEATMAADSHFHHHAAPLPTHETNRVAFSETDIVWPS